MRVLGIFVVAAAGLTAACGNSSGSDGTEPSGGGGVPVYPTNNPLMPPPQGAVGGSPTTPGGPGPVVGAGGIIPGSTTPPTPTTGPVINPFPTPSPTGGAGTPGAGGASVTPPPPPPVPSGDLPGTVSVQVQTFTLNPGQEVFKCQNFDNPFGGQDTAVQRIVSDMSSGSHHLHLYNLTEGTGRTLEDCSPNDFHALIHAAGQPHQETDYPAGMATKIKGATGLRIQLHYINTTQSVQTVNASVKLSPVDASTVTQWVAQLYFNRVVLSVPPGNGQIVSTTCSIPAAYGAITLIGGGSHMHRRGVHFVATTNTGATLADTTQWDEPPINSYNPYVLMNPNDSITWTCTYNNDTGQTLTFGPSALTNEMCIYLARYYSSSADDAQIECQAPSSLGGTARINTN